MNKVQEIVRKEVHDVLDKYLAGKLLVKIESEIVANLEWELINMEADKDGSGS